MGSSCNGLQHPISAWMPSAFLWYPPESSQSLLSLSSPFASHAPCVCLGRPSRLCSHMGLALASMILPLDV
eukprot:scaffold254083_cov32-Tisochrysis_lutea.AAC.1